MKPSPRRSTPSLSALQAFEMAAAHLSFQRAAKLLGLTPSAVSHRIRGLEERFGVRLFARTGRAIRLTEAGEHYLAIVSASLDALEHGSRDLQSLGASGPDMRISALPFFTSTVIIPALHEFRKRFPATSLQVAATNDYADFNHGGVDAAIRYGREQSSGLRFEPLLEVSSIAVCSPQLARRLKKPADLAEHPLIHLTVQPNAWPVWLGETGLQRAASQGDLWFDNVLSALEAARAGFGIALAMHPLIASHSEYGRSLVAPFELPRGRGNKFYLVYRSEHARTRRIVILKRWLADAVKAAARG